MKPTNSKDGKKRVDMRITHRVGGEDFVSALCVLHQSDDADELPDLTRAQIEEKVREVLTKRPDDRYWWRDDLEDDDADTLLEWAEELVQRRFPELY
jgi:hypothetical protein